MINNNIQNQQEKLIDKFGKYEDYVVEAKALNQKTLSLVDWIAAKQKQLANNQEANLKRQETFLANQEQIHRRQVKTVDGILSAQESRDFKESEYKKELSLTLTKGFKDFLGIRNDIKALKNPGLAASNTLRKATDSLVNFEELPPIFKDLEKGIFGSLDLVLGKIVDPMVSGIGGFLAKQTLGRARENKQAKYLADNDPEFAAIEDRKVALEEAKIYLENRKNSIKELQQLEEQRVRLSELGSSSESLEEKISEIRDFLSSGRERERESSPDKSPSTNNRAKPSQVSRNTSVGLSEKKFVEYSSAIDSNLTAVVIGLSKLDNRLVAVQQERKEDASKLYQKIDDAENGIIGALYVISDSIADTLAFNKRKALADEEALEESSRVRRLEGSKPQQNEELTARTEEVESKSGWLMSALAGIGGIFGLLSEKITGKLAAIKKLFGGLPDIFPDIDVSVKDLKNAFKTFGSGIVSAMRFVATRIIAPIAAASIAVETVRRVVKEIEEAEIFDENGKLTKVGSFVNKSQKLLGGAGIEKPRSEMSMAEKIEDDADTGWWDFTGRKKNNAKRQWQGYVDRSGEVPQEVADALRKNFDLFVPKEKISKNRSILDRSAPVAKSTGTEIESQTTKLSEVKESIERESNQSAPVVIAPSSVNTVSNTTAIGLRPKARFYESTFERMVGDRHRVGF